MTADQNKKIQLINNEMKKIKEEIGKIQETNNNIAGCLFDIKSTTENNEEKLATLEKKCSDNYEFLKSKPNLSTYKERNKQVDKSIAEINLSIKKLHDENQKKTLERQRIQLEQILEEHKIF